MAVIGGGVGWWLVNGHGGVAVGHHAHVGCGRSCGGDECGGGGGGYSDGSGSFEKQKRKKKRKRSNKCNLFKIKSETLINI